jgi:hypothetical protein
MESWYVQFKLVMDPPEKRRKKKDKAREKLERGIYSSKHVRLSKNVAGNVNADQQKHFCK